MHQESGGGGRNGMEKKTAQSATTCNIPLLRQYPGGRTTERGRDATGKKGRRVAARLSHAGYGSVGLLLGTGRGGHGWQVC